MIPILPYNETAKETVFSRVVPEVDVTGAVKDIIANVVKRGDEALLEYCARFDGAKLESLAVSAEEIDAALEQVSPELIRILEKAAANIRKFHQAQVRQGFELKEADGTMVGQKIIPMDRVGIYVPGGTAAYPSTVLMDSIPAKIAGCGEIVMVTPPGKEGKVNPAILAAAKVAGVDKIVGPGNAYVAEAKRQVFGQVAIDMIAGPSEILVVADGSANPAYVAADLLSQAEHDKMASAVLVTDSMELAKAVQQQIEEQLRTLEREEIARASIDNNGKIIVAEDLEAVIDIANTIAPEHLELCVEDPFDYLPKIRHAGSVFMGKYCPEALGDYLAGPNHTLPTSGTARFSSPLSVDDFVKKTQYIYYTPEALKAVARDVEYFAKTEGLTAHARSAVIRLEEEK